MHGALADTSPGNLPVGDSCGVCISLSCRHMHQIRVQHQGPLSHRIGAPEAPGSGRGPTLWDTDPSNIYRCSKADQLCQYTSLIISKITITDDE